MQLETLTLTIQDHIATVRLNRPDKANAMYFASLRLNLRDDDPDYPAVLLGNYMLGGGFLNSRLATRVRRTDGLSYGVGSQMQTSSLDRDGQFMVYAIYAPQNVAKLETAIKEEIERMLKDGFTDAELKEAKSGLTGAVRMASASEIASLSRPLRSGPNRMPVPSPLVCRRRSSFAALSGERTGFTISRGRAVVATT